MIKLKNLLFEDIASRSTAQAKKILLPFFKNDVEKVNKTISAMENDLPFLRNNINGGKGKG